MLSQALFTFLAVSSFPPAEPVVDAIKANYVPLKSVEAGKGFEDMAPLKSALADVQIVGMGESTHGSREIFQMKHRMFEFLVKEMGYTVFALEASLPECVAMDRYVMTGEGNVNAAVRAQRFWTWSTEEVADLIKWMRAYNQDPANKNKLRVVGVDMQSRLGAAKFLKEQFDKAEINSEGVFHQAMSYPRPNLDMVKIDKIVQDGLPKIKEKAGTEQAELIKQVGVVLQQAYRNEQSSEWKQEARKVAPYLMDTVRKSPDLLKSHTGLQGDALAGMQLLEKSSKTVYDPTEEEKNKLAGFAKAVREYAATAKSDKAEFERSANVLDYFAKSFQFGDASSNTNYRDECMAKNMEWAVKTYFPGQKAMLWAHNMHIARWEQTSSFRWLGAYLDDVFKAKYYPVGFSFYEGGFQAMDPKMSGLKEWKVGPAPKGSLDETLHQTGAKQFFLDFGKLTGETKAWFDQTRTTRTIGAVYSNEHEKEYFMSLVPTKMFSGMIFINKTTRAKPLPRGL